MVWYNRGYLSWPRSVTGKSRRHLDAKLQLIALYDEPDVFRPERFLESQYGTKMGADVTDLRDNLAFGAGRVSTHIKDWWIWCSRYTQRICPGAEVARRSIVRALYLDQSYWQQLRFIRLSILWVFCGHFTYHPRRRCRLSWITTLWCVEVHWLVDWNGPFWVRLSLG